MSTLLSDLRTESRALLQEAVARFFSDVEIDRWINYGLRDWSTYVQWYQRVAAQSVSLNQFIYPLPSDILKVEMVRWQDSYRLRKKNAAGYAARTFQTQTPPGIPDIWWQFPHDKKLYINPGPTASSPATTLNGGINDTVTSITLTSTADLPASGIVIIESEQIRYFAKSATQILQCVRGDGDTTAAAHLTGVAVTEGTLVIYTRALPPLLVNAGDVCKIPDQWTMDIATYVAWRGNLKRGTLEAHKVAESFRGNYMARRQEASEDRFEESMDGSEGVQDVEFGTGTFGEE